MTTSSGANQLRIRLAVIGMGVVLGLTGCTAPAQDAPLSGADTTASPEAQVGDASSPDPVPAVKVCPQSVISFIEGLYGPSQSQDLTTINASLNVSLPAGADCVLTVAGDTAGSTAYYLFWSAQDQGFADSIGQLMRAAGYVTDSAPLGSVEDPSADAHVYAYPADGTFGGDGYVELSGQFGG
ncbi:MAG: hypothetical protein JWP19_357 [Rhodoglobus sp.]|nr:hypothetical protein [Rhodoglobus sp.]